jgi:hypothetical protein
VDAGPVDHRADDLVTRRRAAPKLDLAQMLLRTMLDAGPRLREDIERRAKGEGVSWRTVETAKSDLDIETSRSRYLAGRVQARRVVLSGMLRNL